MPGKILIANGSPTIRNVAESLLNKHGYEVFLADDGLKTLGTLKIEKPNVLFLDYSLPVLNGEQVLAELNRSRDLKPAYVVMLLDKEQEKNKRELELHGVKAFLIKPFSPKELLDMVESLLSPKGGPADKESKTSFSSPDQKKSGNGLDILETSDLMEDYERSIPDSQKTGVHGFDWFLSELQKEIKDETVPGSEPLGDANKQKEKAAPRLEETFIKYQPTEPVAEGKPENNHPSFEGEAPENFIEDLRKELEALEPVEEGVTTPATVEMPPPVRFDQLLAEIRSRISARVAQEVSKMISPEFLEKIIREEFTQLKEHSNEKNTKVKQDISS
jgi:DNA-binding response OmpR family regulator